jgi:hypothetical protein
MLSKLTHITEESMLLLLLLLMMVRVFFFFRCDGRWFGFTCLMRMVHRGRRIFAIPPYFLLLESMRSNAVAFSWEKKSSFRLFAQRNKIQRKKISRTNTLRSMYVLFYYIGFLHLIAIFTFHNRNIQSLSLS